MTFRTLLIVSVAAIGLAACNAAPKSPSPAETVQTAPDFNNMTIMEYAELRANQSCKENGIALGEDCDRYLEAEDAKVIAEREAEEKADLEYATQQAIADQCDDWLPSTCCKLYNYGC